MEFIKQSSREQSEDKTDAAGTKGLVQNCVVIKRIMMESMVPSVFFMKVLGFRLSLLSVAQSEAL